MLRMSRGILENAIFFPIMYAALVVTSFATAYRFMGVDKHFVITDELSNRPWFASFYIAIMAQTNAMGDATPKTVPARFAFALQTVLGWMWVVTFAVVVAMSST